MAALDDSPRPGRAPDITDNARAWLVSLACQKAKDLGYPHELWTTRLLARQIREHAAAMGHPCLANIVQGTVCKILARHAVKPRKVRYYLERLDEAFDEDSRCARRLSRSHGASRQRRREQCRDHLVSRRSRASRRSATSHLDWPPEPGSHDSFARDHEYKRQGTLSLLVGIDQGWA